MVSNRPDVSGMLLLFLDYPLNSRFSSFVSQECNFYYTNFAFSPFTRKYSVLFSVTIKEHLRQVKLIFVELTLLHVDTFE